MVTLFHAKIFSLKLPCDTQWVVMCRTDDGEFKSSPLKTELKRICGLEIPVSPQTNSLMSGKLARVVRSESVTNCSPRCAGES